MPLVLFCLIAATLIGPRSAAAQNAADVGTLIIAHGGGEAWNGRVKEVVAQTNPGGPVELAFLMGPDAATHRFQDAVAALARRGAQRIVVVPLLVSSHSGHYEQIRWLTGEVDELSEVMRHHLAMAGIERPAETVPMVLAPAMDDAPEVARVLTERALALAEQPSSEAVMLVGHGPNGLEDLAAWMENLRRVAEGVRTQGGFRDVRVGLVQDDAPAAVRAEAVRRVRDLVELQASTTGRPVVVVPILVSKGEVSDRKLPADLSGLTIRYSGEPLLPHEGMARWIEARVHSAVGHGR
jgi:sirohydrochlorin ferrochelatase